MAEAAGFNFSLKVLPPCNASYHLCCFRTYLHAADTPAFGKKRASGPVQLSVPNLNGARLAQ
jgi:hypothetical protein